MDNEEHGGDTLYKGERDKLLNGIAAMRRSLDGMEMVLRRGTDPRREALHRIISEEARKADKRPVRYARFKIEKDEEVRDYVRGLLAKGTMTQTAMAEDCLAKFGKDRAPSQSSLARYIKALREAERGK